MAIQQVSFKKDSGAATVVYNAIIVTPSFIVNESRYTLLDFTRVRDVHGKWKAWDITFTFLNEADQDYLLELSAEEAPQMILDSITYDIEVLSVNPNFREGTISVVNRSPE